MKPELPDETLLAIGRATVTATILEWVLAQFVHQFLGDDVDDLMSKAGKPRARSQIAARGLAAILSLPGYELPNYWGFVAWVDEAGRLLDDRNKVVHSFWRVAGVTDDGSPVLSGEHVKSKSEIAVDSPLLIELAARLDAAAARGVDLFIALQRGELPIGHHPYPPEPETPTPAPSP